jgi:hypothetical protein
MRTQLKRTAQRQTDDNEKSPRPPDYGEKAPSKATHNNAVLAKNIPMVLFE